MEQNEETIPTGIHWTYREVLRGKASITLVIGLAIICVASCIFALWLGDDSMKGITIPGLITDILTLKADMIAQDLALTLVVSAPILVLLWPIITLGIMIYCNVRDRNLPQTPENLYLHELEAATAWTWPWSMIIGTCDFTASFSVALALIAFVGTSLSFDSKELLTFIATIGCLVFAERRIQRATRAMTTRLRGNHETVKAIMDGKMDHLLPEEMRDDLGRAKAATTIRLGVVRSPKHAILIAKGINLRTKVKMFSAFLNSAVHGMVSAISFGIASTVANELGDIGGKTAAGSQDVVVENLMASNERRPHFIIEAICIIACVVIATFTIVAGLPTV